VTDGKPIISDVIKEKQTSANFYDNVDLRSSISQISNLSYSISRANNFATFIFIFGRSAQLKAGGFSKSSIETKQKQ
jgi:hypothetical protein